MDLSIPNYQIPEHSGLSGTTPIERVKLVFVSNSLTENERQFLQKVSISAGLEGADYKILENPSKPFSRIKKIYPKAMLFLLGEQSNKLLPHFDKKKVYEVLNVSDQKIVFIHGVTKLMQDVNAKKHLWKILKTHFVNS